MIFADRVLALLLSLPAHFTDHESPAERATRLRPAAAEIAVVASWATCTGLHRATPGCRVRWRGGRSSLAAAIITVGWLESRYARYVGEGRCAEGPLGARCDEGRSRGYYQQQRSACPNAFLIEPGSSLELEVTTWCAARLLASAAFTCRQVEDPAAGWFAGYAGWRCDHERGRARAARYRSILSRLERVPAA